VTSQLCIIKLKQTSKMEAINLEQLYRTSQSIQPEHLVYEAEDEALMLYFTVCKNEKCYHSKMTIDWTGLNWIIGKASQMGLDIYDNITSKLFDVQDRFREYQFDSSFVLIGEQSQIAA
jgi:hypothetical protein